MAIVTYPLNNIKYTAEDAEQYLCTRTSGVFSSENNFAIQLSSAWGVTIGTGVAWIKNTDFSGKSVVNTESKELDIGLADPTFPKIVRIVLEYDKAKNSSDIIVLSGTPATKPEPPAISRTESKYDLCLYEITIPAGASQITMSNVKNTMLDESLCGIMRDAVTGIPTAQLQSQVQSLIDELNEALQGAIDGSLYIPRTEKATANGIATLDESALVPMSQIPVEQGKWTPKFVDRKTGSPINFTASSIEAMYFKFGNIVFFSCAIYNTNAFSVDPNNQSGISGLPFNSSGRTSAYIGRQFNIFKLPELGVSAAIENKMIVFYYTRDYTNVPFSGQSSGSLYVSGWYFTEG